MTSRFGLVVAISAAAALGACKKEEPPPAKTQPKSEPAAAKEPPGVQVPDAQLTMFKPPLPEVAESKGNPITDEKIGLGRMLYFEPRMSKNHDISCNTCHDLTAYGVDGRDVSLGHKGQKGDRNSPTVYNAALHFVQFWDGRAADVEEQAKGPVLNPVEMGMPSEAHVVKTLKSIPGYVEAFKKAFPDDEDPITFDNFAKAVAAFERGPLTPARWDEFLTGDQKALTDDEKKGFLKFVEVGCPECHTGTLVGGTMFQKLGREKPWPNVADKGRFAVTKSASDEMMFKVPSLRNVEHTAPYFHDHSAKTLNEAVKAMAAHQLGKQLSDEDVASIATWLKSLSGEIPKKYIEKPELPESGPQTPKPDPS